MPVLVQVLFLLQVHRHVHSGHLDSIEMPILRFSKYFVQVLYGSIATTIPAQEHTFEKHSLRKYYTSSKYFTWQGLNVFVLLATLIDRVIECQARRFDALMH